MSIVIEGAGSVTELNLRDHDLVNLGLVDQHSRAVDARRRHRARRRVRLGDRHRPPADADERSLFRGFAINKFRGDISLFDEGVRMLEERTASHCFGVFPYAADIHLDAEDSLALRDAAAHAPRRRARGIAIVRLPHLSNATDFRLLTWADWIASPPPADYDFVILPGSKNTIADLAWLRDVGLADWILEQHRSRRDGHRHLRRVSDAGTDASTIRTAMESTPRSAEGSVCCRSTTRLTPRQTDAVRSRRPRAGA